MKNKKTLREVYKNGWFKEGDDPPCIKNVSG